MTIRWKSSYSVGVSVMDNEHRSLFNVMHELDNALAAGSGQLVIDTVLAKVTNWAEQHFTHEEELMLENGFPGYEAHRAEHDQARRQLETYEHDRKAGKQGVPVSLLLFLDSWLRQHILKIDLQYAGYLNQRGIR
ncbi:Hemerythrin-like, metal-binding protein [Candidatus Koribacter versatilis Ellin345]|uniref:Hemerythrin-like, metal-binding protein n=1 Tax=Koribacter versatilis (strain Ellin345) TaxID=204669 RepID=Q1II57_KORVE|nr:bacteriohemerythrin [Candidatus Koribacter versatilis]ABF43443.1 Hemerythrin-like, metal-binding protein [Candidatus Koribacter versatilis Ellin345]